LVKPFKHRFDFDQTPQAGFNRTTEKAFAWDRWELGELVEDAGLDRGPSFNPPTDTD
jgi:hypothetical protein